MRLAPWYVLGGYVLVGIAAASAPSLLLMNFFHDDAFFYVKTANNIAAGLGATFDGRNSINGYHLL
jgi:hypothetical protein